MTCHLFDDVTPRKAVLSTTCHPLNHAAQMQNKLLRARCQPFDNSRRYDSKATYDGTPLRPCRNTIVYDVGTTVSIASSQKQMNLLHQKQDLRINCKVLCCLPNGNYHVHVIRGATPALPQSSDRPWKNIVCSTSEPLALQTPIGKENISVMHTSISTILNTYHAYI